jgi:hypothetical protein
VKVLFDENEILKALDQCCTDFSFPMLDNGYVYLAACRLSLHRSVTNWAMVLEVFGFSPRAGFPDTAISTFAKALHDRNPPEGYVSADAYQAYLTNNPHNEFRAVFPIEEGSWQDAENSEVLNSNAQAFSLRGMSRKIPDISAYGNVGIRLEEPEKVRTHEFCRWLAAVEREAVLATPVERRVSLTPEMNQILLLEEWHHPDLCAGEVASDSETFRQLARVLATGDISHYAPTMEPNNHWINWPAGGSL